MERLTRRMCGGYGIIPGCELNTLEGAKSVVDRLAAYEGTGLEPEEIVALQASFQELKKEAVPLMKAKIDGRLVVLPQIPKYKTLYWLWGDEIMPVRYWGLRGGCVDERGQYHATCRMRTKKDRVFHHTVHRKPKDIVIKAGDMRYFYADDLGKTVFLTRSEAEMALAAQKEKKG